MWLVLDTNVLVDASGQGVKDYAEVSHELLKSLMATPLFVLAIDKRQKILREYEARVNAQMFAYHWLERLRRELRIRAVTSVEIPRAAAVALREAHFDNKDYPLVQAALYSSKIIITREFRSFSARVVSILRRELKITVMDASRASMELRTCTGSGQGECPANSE